MAYASVIPSPSWLTAGDSTADDSTPPRRRTDRVEDGLPSRRSRRAMRPTGRWRFLADASAVLDASLDFEQTLANTVRLAVPEVADYCIVVLAGEDGSGRWAHAAHRDPAGRELLDRARERFPLPASSDHPLARAIRTGEPQLVPTWVEADRDRLGETGAGRARLLAPVSAIATPMVARGRTFGAILFAATAQSQRRYGLRDLELAVDVGRRAGHAIDHALLYRAAEDAARLREQLMAVVAHDLKTPVATIELALRVFLDEDVFPDDGRHKIERHALGSIQRASARMYRLIHDLLDLSRADRGQLPLQAVPVDPGAMVADAVEAHATLAASRRITIDSALETHLPAVLADPERVAQVFSNLIDNALKFTPEGGRVRVTAARCGTSVEFAVEDTGAGITAEHLPHVFDRFWQAQSTARGGTGLGLSIAKAVVEAHGGRIGVASTRGAGTRFHFSLPVSGGAPEPSPA